MIKKISLLVVLLGLATGCTNSFYGDEWQCPVNQGKGCNSISDVENTSGKDGGTPQKKLEGVEINTTLKNGARTPEYVGEIDFFPFVDNDKNYHEGAKIKKIFKKSEWK